MYYTTECVSFYFAPIITIATECYADDVDFVEYMSYLHKHISRSVLTYIQLGDAYVTRRYTLKK